MQMINTAQILAAPRIAQAIVQAIAPATPQGSEDSFEIIDATSAADAFGAVSRPSSRPLFDSAAIATAAATPARYAVHPAYAVPQPAYASASRPIAPLPRPPATAPAALTPQQLQQASRQKELASYERLLLPLVRLGAWHKASQLRCPLTNQPLESIARPVLVRRHQSFFIYDEAAFLQWWLDNGTEPMSGRRICLMALYRPCILPGA